MTPIIHKFLTRDECKDICRHLGTLRVGYKVNLDQIIIVDISNENEEKLMQFLFENGYLR
jgi:hypothetical protein